MGWLIFLLQNQLDCLCCGLRSFVILSLICSRPTGCCIYRFIWYFMPFDLKPHIVERWAVWVINPCPDSVQLGYQSQLYWMALSPSFIEVNIVNYQYIGVQLLIFTLYFACILWIFRIFLLFQCINCINRIFLIYGFYWYIWYKLWLLL